MQSLLKRKRLILILATAGILTTSSFVRPEKKVKPKTDDLEGTISISGAFALYPMTVK